MRLSKYEQETIINFNEDEPTADVYTYNRRLRSKLTKIAGENSDCRIIKDAGYYSEFAVPKKWVKVSPPKKYSEDTLRKMSENGKRQAEAMNNKNN